MGQPKALLPFDDGRCFARKLADEFYHFGCKQVVLVTNDIVLKQISSVNYRFDDIVLVYNPNPGLGRFYSLYLALTNLTEPNHVFIANTDNPFIGSDVLRLLREHSKQADYICPTYQGKGGHPILVSPNIVNAVKSETSFHYNLKDYLNRFSKACVNVDNELVLVNINTFEDYYHFFNRRLS